MTTTIDSAGRLVIPKKIRELAGLRPGLPLAIRVEAGKIEIEPEPANVRLVRKGPLLVAVSDTPVAPLTPDAVEEVRETLQRGRGGKA
jgi:AbrB family looped-hinge helix DNA binding protein